MDSFEDRLKALESRCSRAAAEFLRDLRYHPQFPQLVSKLEKIDGLLFRLDIEQELMELIKGKPPSSRKAPTSTS